MKNVLVSVICITYNQVDYIREAIDSFLNQETDFEFEILIHDDASTDGTAEIVKEYADRYPEKITAILQKENQYSKGVKISTTYIFPIVKGKYVALCEGDDFWTDNKKLQKQADYMEDHPECSMCIHDGWILSEDKKIVFNSKPLSRNPEKYGIREAIEGLGIKVVTNSFFYRAQYLQETYPHFMQIAPTGDYGRVVCMALKGYIYYMPEKMSAHRMLAKNSFSKTMGNGEKSQKKWEIYLEKQTAMMKELDTYTDYKYTDIIQRSLQKQKFNNYLLTRNKEKLSSEPYKSMLKKSSLKQKLQYYFPVFYKQIIQRIHYFYLKIKSKGKF